MNRSLVSSRAYSLTAKSETIFFENSRRNSTRDGDYIFHFSIRGSKGFRTHFQNFKLTRKNFPWPRHEYRIFHGQMNGSITGYKWLPRRGTSFLATPCIIVDESVPVLNRSICPWRGDSSRFRKNARDGSLVVSSASLRLRFCPLSSLDSFLPRCSFTSISSRFTG